MDPDPLVGRGFRGEEVFNTLDGFIKDKRSELDPTVLWTHCNLHGAVLAFKTLPDKLKKGLDISVKITNHIKSRPLQCHLLELLLHTEVRWLSLGQVLTRLVERCKVVAVFLDKIGATFGRMFCKTHPDSSAAAWKVLLLFTSSYFCEIRLSVMVAIET
ncbi:Zinc finger BED domain-containing protein 5 [Trichinella sp. T6]|nr:Zinc finger BED domain-containing protein 5 [Trichinella sp. T6]